MCEAEEVERAGGSFTMSLAIATGKATKPKQFRFLLSQLKMEAPKASGEYRLKASSIRFSVKRTNEIIRIADDVRLPCSRGLTSRSNHSSRT